MSARAALLASVEGYCCPHCSKAGGWAVRSALSRRAFSTNAVLACTSCGERVFLKSIVGPSVSWCESEARSLFDAAKYTYELFPSSRHFSAARPLYHNGTVLLFAFVDGVSPSLRLHWALRDDATALAGRIGEWFAIFHLCQRGIARAPGTDAIHSGADVAAQAQELQSDLLATGLWNGLVERAVADLSRRAAGLSVGDVAREVRLHGDAKPGNFLVDGDQIVGIDVNGVYRGMPEIDIAQCDVQLRISSAVWRGDRGHRRAASLSKAMIAGYRSRAALDEQRLVTMRLMYMLRTWLTWRSTSRLAAWHWDRHFRAQIRALFLQEL